MINKGYERALAIAREQLKEMDPAVVVENTGVCWDGEAYWIPWFDKKVKLEEGAVEEQILWHHYLLANGPKSPRNIYINYKQVPGAAIYNDNFIKRSIAPMVKSFHSDLDKFLDRGLRLGGCQVNHGDRAFTLHPLPYVPLTYILWQGDDEIPPNGNILFDETAIEWFCAEDLVVLASLPVYRMLKMQ